MERADLHRILRNAPTGDERVAWFGALLARESGLDERPIIVGESALEVYLTSSRHGSQDIDIVGEKPPIVSVSRRWGFRERKGRSARLYWIKEGLGSVDLVGSRDRSGLEPRTETTSSGPVRLTAIE